MFPLSIYTPSTSQTLEFVETDQRKTDILNLSEQHVQMKRVN